MELITPEFGLIFWTGISFLILLFILKKFAWKPILNSVNTREQSIKDALAAAEAAKREMENLTADNERILKEARAERETLLKEAREIKTKMIADAEEDAKVKADKLIANAQAAIETEKKAAISELKAQVANLSLDIAEKVVKAELSNKDKQLKLVEDMLGDAKLN
ncbi:F0F1 ATP synthase subunit B [Aureisphaera sp. CAU 1614]|jgi:F-type H+-transporting ATPase subunit b|uniref:ATP synthase subunit b n=1 Tax=Halomarinibacterium sedimenti TaxID=2857106 RepID=A0A9X1FML6_9FLAO|nr:F0F1 ATP synthase subunit B [Halomarinibacterium sedimenti]MAL60489.1 ATP synthase F0 subunit B [Flavobacteriaceae bacterium]MBW2937222.1 F0F1 ATP synthase subunit B [Halomarinibacterium sedimenti]HAT64724.1 ATP synthase F0 subunit B [Flavobacteriaceae bacterium]|tara:strand:+ start:1542 stop:2036 length:495 start_codon:yes stop_codon:yes gene_type:complete